MRDEIRVQKRPQVRGVAAACVFVVVGDERPEIRSVTRLGRDFRLRDEIADLVLGRAGSPAAGNGESRGQCESSRFPWPLRQGESPTAGGRR